jgi:hypothetical protein
MVTPDAVQSEEKKKEEEEDGAMRRYVSPKRLRPLRCCESGECSGGRRDFEGCMRG